MKHDNDNRTRGMSAKASIASRLSELWNYLVQDTIWTLQNSRTQPLLQPVKVVARARDRNPRERRY